MADRRRIRMSDQEVAELLAEVDLVTCATVGPGGRPHLMPMFFAADGIDVLCFTYAASQKVRNLERDPRATLQVEAGRRYEELRGVMMECDAELSRDLETVTEVGLAIARRMGPVDERGRAVVARQAPKRVAVRFRPTRIVSWDHRKG